MIRAEEAPTTLSRSRRSSKNHAEIENKAAEDEDKVVRRGMILPFQPLSISFDDVCYYVDMPAVRYPPNLFSSSRLAQM